MCQGSDVMENSVRKKIMSSIPSKDTSIEIAVRRYLFAHGFRYRKNDKRYPGHPDIVLPKYKTVIFVNGCFWHGHGCKNDRKAKSNTDYWNNKINKNIERDLKNSNALIKMGFKVLVVWECELKEDTEKRLELLINEIVSDNKQ